MSNYANDSYKLEDYVALYIADATQSGDFYTWQIPQSYYTNRRSQVATVTCRGGSIETTTVVHGIVVNYVNGAQNAYASGNEQAIVTHGYQTIEHSNNKMAFNFTQNSELLVSARPQQIVLKITDHEKGSIASIKGCLTLKFCYYNQLDTGENLHKQYTNTL